MIIYIISSIIGSLLSFFMVGIILRTISSKLYDILEVNIIGTASDFLRTLLGKGE
jgi:hypothetical protein